MPVETEQTVQISCDNPNCPGNTLDPNDRTGWTFVNTEVYGQPTQQHVFCCPDCVGTLTSTLSAEAAPVQAEA
jgi:hypothetical protein